MTLPAPFRSRLARGVTIAAGASAMLTFGIQPSAPVSAAAPAHIAGTVTAAPSTAAPTSFTFRRRNNLTATISVSTSTVVVRRYGGRTGITAVGAGDSLQVWGSFEAGNTVFDATKIEDASLQYTSGRGKVLTIDTAANTMTVRVTGKSAGSPIADIVTVSVPAGSSIPVQQGSPVPLTSVQVGDVVSVGGVYNRTSKTFTSATSLRILRLASATTLRPATIAVVGYKFERHHYAVVHIHTVAGAKIQIQIHFKTRIITINGTSNAAGNFQAQRQLAVGRWAAAKQVRTVATITNGTAQRTISKTVWVS
jgi:hypothetical protein